MLSTTQLLVEHIISGLLAMIWIGIGLIILLDTGAEDLIAPLLDNWSVTTLFIGAIAYPTGLVVDEIADRLLGMWNRKIKRKANIAEDKSTLQYLSEIKNENTLRYFTYNRFKIRIVRSAFLNFLLIALMIAISGYYLVAVVFVVGSGLSLWLWGSVSRKMYRMMVGM